MRRELRILLMTVALGAGWVWGGRVPELLAGMETFRVTEVEVEGLRYLTRAEVVEAMGITTQSSVWGDMDGWTDALVALPMVRTAEVHRRIPGALLVTLVERVPVALVSTPVVEPVDREGVRLPLDPAEHRFDLPLVEVSRAPAKGSRLLPQEARELVHEVDRLMSVDTDFLRMVSEVRWGGRRSIVARWMDPDVEFWLPLGASPDRLSEGLAALAHALARPTEGPPATIDLRFADQIVVHRTEGTGP